MAKKSKSSGSTPAIAVLNRARAAYTEHLYDHDALVTKEIGFGMEAAVRLDADPGQVFKTLLVEVTGRPSLKFAVGVVPVSSTLSLKALAAAVGAKKATLLPAADAERISGSVVGGISPLAPTIRPRRDLAVVIDASATSYETIFVSGGRRGLDIGLGPRDLIEITGARIASVAS